MLLLLAGLAAISGIFYPITHLPVFLQWTGQVFPMYWLGLGMRSALLPNAMAAVEVGHSWRHLATFGVLSAWAIAGLVLAPVSAAADGAPRVRLERRGPPRESDAETMSSEVIYNRIAMLRAERGISRRELADALGVHYQTVGYLERGEYSPSLYLALRIAAHFEVPVEVIFSTEPFPRLGTAATA